MGDIIDLYPYDGVIKAHNTDTIITHFQLKTATLLDEVRAGGRIPLMIGKTLTEKAKAYLNFNETTPFTMLTNEHNVNKGYTLAQKIVGKACNKAGVYPDEYCEPKIATVGSQDTTGTMTCDELKSLACLKFSADLVMQSLCHTSAYPKKIDIEMHQTLPAFFKDRGGVALIKDDGIIHSWLNRMLLPDTVGTGGDSHTRFPIGISFPAGSGLVAFAAAAGIMPLDMPESVLVRFKGTMNNNVTLRDLVHAIPYYARKKGLLTVEKNNKKNVFSGRILEIEGLEHLTVEQAFELTDASAERSATACTIKLSENSVAKYLQSNIVLLRWMITQGYGDAHALEQRAKSMEAWLKSPELLSADQDAQYAEIIEIDLDEIKEPILCVPNDPDDARLLSTLNEQRIDEVFIGSCMTNIGHFRASAHLLQNNEQGRIQSKLWISPPTKMDKQQLLKEGLYNVFGRTGARVESPGCSLCMGNQARVGPNTNVVSTSTRNFPHRMGDNANVYLASAELATISAILGRLPKVEEYNSYMETLREDRDTIYNYLNFDQMPDYVNAISISKV